MPAEPTDRLVSQAQAFVRPELPPADFFDPVIEAYKKDVDRTLLRENLKLTPEERLYKFERFAAFAAELREAGRRHREGR